MTHPHTTATASRAAFRLAVTAALLLQSLWPPVTARPRRTQVAALELARRDAATGGVTHLTLRQRVNGVEVFQSRMNLHLDRRGAVFAADGELLPRAAELARSARTRLTAAESLKLAARTVGVELSAAPPVEQAAEGRDERQTFDAAGVFARDAAARLVYFPIGNDELRAAWEFELWSRETPDAYLVVIDAARGSLLYRRNLTCYEGDPATPRGLVYEGDSPRPDRPHTHSNPPRVERRMLPFSGAGVFAATDPHYDWWAGKAATGLVSNNADGRGEPAGGAGEPVLLGQPLSRPALHVRLHRSGGQFSGGQLRTRRRGRRRD
jgi:hypothetical protein